MDREQIKIAHRFLKETGLFSQWKCYLNSLTEFYRIHIYDSNSTIDVIFGRCLFTEYLLKKGIRMKGVISAHFRRYLILVYGNKFTLLGSSCVPEGSFTFDRKTGIYKIIFEDYDQ